MFTYNQGVTQCFGCEKTTMFAENRVHPRVSIDLTAQIGMYGVPLEEQPALAKITNISLGGITVQGEQALVRSLRLDRPESQRSSEFMVGFCLDGECIECHCRLVHVRRLAQHQYEWGMRFIYSSAAQKLQLAALIDSYF